MMSAPRAETARITEIFSSIQGEGVYVGDWHIFVRFAGCNLSCVYCDEPAALAEGKPVAADWALGEISRFAAKRPHSAVSLTGGEPLLHSRFISGIIPGIKSLGLAVYLETNATLGLALKQIIGGVDIVSADIKLPSACGRELWAQHEKFLALCSDKVFVKIVVLESTSEAEIERAARLICGVSRAIPLVLQPVTPGSGKMIECPRNETLAKLESCAKRHLKDVRILSQQHRVWGVK